MGCFLSCFPVCRSLHCQLLCSCLCPKLVFQFAFCWCGAFSTGFFAIQFIVGVLVCFELSVLQAGVSVRVLLVRSFSPRFFCYSVHCWRSCWFWAFPCRFCAFPHRGFCSFAVSVTLLVCAFRPRGFCNFAVSVFCCRFVEPLPGFAPCWFLLVVVLGFSLLGFLLSNCFVVFQ